MQVTGYVMQKKYKILLGIFILGVGLGLYKLTAFLFGFGISLPPNRCDLVSGYELRGDLLVKKRDICLNDLAMEENDARICKFMLSGGDGCLREIAIRKDDPEVCRNISEEFTRDDCLYLFAQKFADNEVDKALTICGKNPYSCQNKVIKQYQQANEIIGKKLVLRCLNYTKEDKVTELLCKLNTGYFINWEGHEDLIQMYGGNYPLMGKRLCEKVRMLEKNEESSGFCFQTVNNFIKEMNRVESSTYEFLQNHPKGLGEPK